MKPVNTQTSRRSFLKAATGRVPRPRPPGALGDVDFHDTCTQCGDCARACPERIIGRDADGLPFVDVARGACTFCGVCTEACETGALTEGAPWLWQATVASSCLALNGIQCRSCEDHCDDRAIRFRLQTGGRAVPQIDPDLCTGCGGCVAPCPSGAIHLTQVTPRKEEVQPC